jgi:TRAP-type C4-dicarboxylate transport system permease small subunit
MIEALSGVLCRLDRIVAATCRWTVVACFLGLFLLLSLGIVQRLLPLVKLSGYDELVELLFIWMTFIGAVALWREGALYRVEAIDRLLNPRGRQALAVLTSLTMLAVAVIFAWKGWSFLLESGETTPFLQVDKVYWYAAIPFSGVLMSVYSVAALWRALRGNLETPGDIVTLG